MGAFLVADQGCAKNLVINFIIQLYNKIYNLMIQTQNYIGLRPFLILNCRFL